MRYRYFGRGTGLRVSELSLGSAVFGTAWGYGAPKDEALRILGTYAENGGNFIDTADFYQFGEAEAVIGIFLAHRRDEFVVASKYTLGSNTEPNVSTTGNSRRNMVRSVEDTLRRMRTDRIDLYWVHMADGVTETEEIARGLDDLVRSGKVLYVGFSDFPAWRTARAITLAELRGWAPVMAVQTEYSLVERDSDREILPMARAFGLGIAAWSPLGGGFLTGKYRRGEPGRATTFGSVVHREDKARKSLVLDVVLAIAQEAGLTPVQVALAWLISHGTVPIIGPRTQDQLLDNLAATSAVLTTEQLQRLDATSAVVAGFPHDFLFDKAQRDRMAGGNPANIIAPKDLVVR